MYQLENKTNQTKHREGGGREKQPLVEVKESDNAP